MPRVQRRLLGSLIVLFEPPNMQTSTRDTSRPYAYNEKRSCLITVLESEYSFSLFLNCSKYLGFDYGASAVLVKGQEFKGNPTPEVLGV